MAVIAEIHLFATTNSLGH